MQRPTLGQWPLGSPSTLSRWSPSTRDRYANACAVHLAPWLDDVPLAELSDPRLRGLQDSRVNEGVRPGHYSTNAKRSSQASFATAPRAGRSRPTRSRSCGPRRQRIETPSSRSRRRPSSSSAPQCSIREPAKSRLSSPASASAELTNYRCSEPPTRVRAPGPCRTGARRATPPRPPRSSSVARALAPAVVISVSVSIRSPSSYSAIKVFVGARKRCGLLPSDLTPQENPL
jgi:hypothetical protein